MTQALQTTADPTTLAIDSLKEGFEVFKANPIECILIPIVAAVVGMFSMGILMPAMMVAQIDAYRRLARGESVGVGVLFENLGDRLVPSLILGLLVGVAVSVGMILLVIPGIIAALALSFSFHYLAFNPTMGAVDCMKASANLVKTHWVAVLVLGLLGSIAIAIGNIVFIGSLIVAPIVGIGGTLMFERLAGQQ